MIVYVLRLFRKFERNMEKYSFMKFEFLVFKWLVSEKFCDYFFGLKFVIYIDNNLFSYINKFK